MALCTLRGYCHILAVAIDVAGSSVLTSIGTSDVADVLAWEGYGREGTSSAW
eukprot:CAMPEP_0174306396 /NCGR_PEP_ID=MMETSP0810-20121108/420_1 /TAXON_ID=73025 ORGANISM="Eutreptiella gymnastica-like, Strain CCMP1594" /NCGR_SAMPLE_ID=MMETSP0810 /ASSEMBLY_ACC=CAM_ASM_000659 /LENGTH=51 /DNA_ID=CAMNT_0015413091 /DNA_START=214 /DNA_END=366 /DNA_ORIENTATION=-